MTPETVYLDADGCTVTSARIVINGQTFATRNVGSVRVEDLRMPTWSIALAAVGGFFLVSGIKSDAWGVIIFGAILAAWGAKRANDGRGQRIMMMAGAGEVAAIASTDKALIDRIHSAIAQAISAR